MAQRLIDADSLKETLDYYICEAGWSKEIKMALRWVKDEFIDAEPTVDAEPVKHGKWIIRCDSEKGWYRIICSACGEDVTSTAPVIGFFPNAKVLWNCCPECGARMDEK